MNTNLLETIIIHEKNTDFSVIWLHGLGADGYNFVPIVQSLKLKNIERIKFIFPHAPIQPVTLFNGFETRAWYDLSSLEEVHHANVNDMNQSLQRIHALIEHEIKNGTPASRIFLAGFSQGSVMALYSGLTFRERIAGIIALSGYTPHTDYFASRIQHKPPVFLAHGTRDDVVPYLLHDRTVLWLTEQHIPFESHQYSMAHEVSLEEIEDLKTWMEKLLPQS